MPDRLDLFGWDTVFATNFTKLNEAIVAQKSTPESFYHLDPDIDATIEGTWGDWQISPGGDGEYLHITCPVTKGMGSGIGDVDLSGGWVRIQVSLNRIPDPDYPYSDPTGIGGMPNKLVVATKSDDDDPPVVIMDTSYKPKGMWGYVLEGMFRDWFVDHLAMFNQVFSVTMLDVKAAKGDYQWLKPAELSYACADAADHNLDTSVFASLCLVTKRDKLPAHQVDARMLESLVDGTDSVFAISAEQFVQHLLVAGATYTIHGSQPGDFTIGNDNLWIQNNKDLVWGNFELDSGKQVSPVIRKGNFQLGLVDQYVSVRITDATFAWPDWKLPGDITVHMNYDQQFELGLRKTSSGHVFVPVDGPPKMNMNSTVVCSKAVLTTELVIGLASGIVLSIVGGVLGGAIGDFASAGAKSATEGVVTVTEETIQRASQQAGREAVEEAEQTAVREAAEDLANVGKPNYLQRFGSAIARNKWKIGGGVLGGILSVPTGMVSQFMQLIAEGDLEKIPPFEGFAANCSGATTFPDVGSSWAPVAAGLQGPLLIQGKFGD